jgi:hypothetical protein
MSEKVQIMSPVYNEGSSICTLYESLIEKKIHFDELYFVYDFDGDTTVPFIKKLYKGMDFKIYTRNSIKTRLIQPKLKRLYNQLFPPPFTSRNPFLHYPFLITL